MHTGMILGSTQPPTEMSTSYISFGEGGVERWLVCRTGNLTTFMCWLLRNCESLKLLERYRSV